MRRSDPSRPSRPSRRAQLAQLIASFTAALVLTLLVAGCAPFGSGSGKTAAATPSQTAGSSPSAGGASTATAVKPFDVASASRAIQQWNLEVQSDRIIDGDQTRSVLDSGWAIDNFHRGHHLPYGFTQIDPTLADTSVVVGSVEYVFFITTPDSVRHYGYLFGTVDHTHSPVSFVIWLDPTSPVSIVQLTSASVASPFNWGLSAYSEGHIYHAATVGALATELTAIGIIHRTIVVWFALAARANTTSAKGTSQTPPPTQTMQVIAALNGTAPSTLPAGMYRDAPPSPLSITPTAGATSPSTVILPYSPIPSFG